jgi:hypothetical protein
MTDKNARPWDVFVAKNKVAPEVAFERYEICKSCPELIQATKTCKKCGCFMTAKTKIAHAFCPIGKWHAVKLSFEEDTEII